MGVGPCISPLRHAEFSQAFWAREIGRRRSTGQFSLAVIDPERFAGDGYIG